MLKIEYGIIDNARLFIEDHSCLVLNVDCRLANNSYVTFGNISLAHKNEPFISKLHKEGDPTNYCGYFITRILGVFDEYSLEDLKNKPCRLIFVDYQCVGIMNYLDDEKYLITKNDWPEKNGVIDLSNIE